MSNSPSDILLYQTANLTAVRCPLHNYLTQDESDTHFFEAYIIIGQADVDTLPDILAPEVFAQQRNIHVSSINQVEEIQDELDFLIEELNPNDALIFFCQSEDLRDELLKALESIPSVTNTTDDI